MSENTDRNLVICILAFQLDFVAKDDLLKCMSQWMHAKDRKLEDLLLEAGLIDEHRHSLLSALAKTQGADLPSSETPQSVGDKHIGGHSAGELSSLYDELATLGDHDLEQSISAIQPQVRGTDRAGKASAISDDFATLAERPSQASRSDRYRILRPHAQGGLGEVSVAQDEELERQVALKEIRSLFADDDTARARFVLEAKVTGALEHPGVVPIYGLGIHSDGRPYYAMRFIRGESLQVSAERFHQQGGLNTSDFLGLRRLLTRLVSACQTIEYAHSRGVLHRDIKPDNIMLGPYGETLVVDWGLAKTTAGSDEDAQPGAVDNSPLSGSQASVTVMGSVIGTPAYMSPEQASGRLNDVGPASDIYSLGATLYFILAGKSPIGATESGKRDAGHLLQMVADGRLARIEQANPRLNSTAWKPLAAICNKAMSLRTEDRYASCAQLAEEIDRFLAGEPVLAFKESWLRRSQRWIRKHQTLATSVGLAVLVGLVGLAVFSAQLRAKQTELEKTNRELVIAEGKASQAADAAETQRQVAEKQREVAEDAHGQALEAQADQRAFANFLVNQILATARPEGQYGGLGIDVTVIEAIENAEQEIPTVFQGRPVAEAIARQGIGDTWLNLGRFERAIPLLERSTELFRQRFGTDNEEYLISLSSLATALSQNGQVKQAIEMQEGLLQTLRRTAGEDDETTLTAMNNLALSQSRAGQYQQAIDLLESVVEKRIPLNGEEDPLTLESQMNLAGVLRLMPDKAEQALEIYKAIQEPLQTALGTVHPITLKAVNNLATFYHELGEYDRSIGMLENLYQKMVVQLGEDHPVTITTLSNLAKVLHDSGQLEVALEHHLDAFDRAGRTLGDTHFNTLNAEDLLGSCYYAMGDMEKAIEHYQHVYVNRQSTLGTSHPDTLNTGNNLALTYDQTGLSEQAIPILEDILRIRRQQKADPSDLMLVLNNLASAYAATGSLTEAVTLYEECLTVMPPEYASERWRIQNNLADCFLQLGQTDRSIEILQSTVDAMRNQLDESELFASPVVVNLAMTHFRAAQYSDAQQWFVEICSWHRQQLEQVDGTGDRNTLRAMLVYLARAQMQLGDTAGAAASARESAEIAADILPQDDWRLFNARSIWGDALLAQGQLEQAEPLLLEAHQGLLAALDSIPLPFQLEFVVPSFDRLIALSEALDDSEQATTWREAKATFLESL